nr:unnamed protein product [Callosobruchus analis]
MCVNCNGSHSARYKGCPVYKNELVIQKLKVTEKLTYNEARKRVTATTPRPNISYSAALQQPQVSESDILDKIKPALEAMIKNCLFEALSNIQPLQLSARLPPPQNKDPGSNVSRSRSTSETLSLPKRKASSPAEESESDGSQLSTETRSSARRGCPLAWKNQFHSFVYPERSCLKNLHFCHLKDKNKDKERGQRLENILEAVTKGMSYKAAAKRFGILRSTIRWLFECHRKGFPRRIDDVLASVQQLIKIDKRETPFKDGRPGKRW